MSPGLLDALHPVGAVRLLLRPQLQRFLSIVAKDHQEVVLRQRGWTGDMKMMLRYDDDVTEP